MPGSIKSKFQINQMKMLQTVSGNHDIKLMGAAWSSPPWMKTNNDWTGTYV